MAKLDELHQKYGSLMIQLEIIQGKVREVKGQIAMEMNKPPLIERPKKEGDKK